MCRYIGSLTSITYQRAKHYSSISLSNNGFYLVNTNTYIYQAVEGPCGKSIPNDLFQQVLSVSDELILSMFVPNSGACYYLINKYCLSLRKMKVFFLNLKFFLYNSKTESILNVSICLVAHRFVWQTTDMLCVNTAQCAQHLTLIYRLHSICFRVILNLTKWHISYIINNLLYKIAVNSSACIYIHK